MPQSFTLEAVDHRHLLHLFHELIFRKAPGQDACPQRALCRRQCSLPSGGEEVPPQCPDTLIQVGTINLETEGWVGGDREEWPILSQFKRLLLQMGRSGGWGGGAMSHKLTEASNLIVFKCDSGLLKINKHESICTHH